MFVFKAAVVGAGTMGGEIAQVIASADVPVVLKDVDQHMVDAGLRRAQEVTRSRLAPLVEKGRLSGEEADAQAEAVVSRIVATLSYDDLADVDLVVEAVPERLELKQAVFADLDAATPGHAVLASNTSTLSITEIADATLRPDKVVGLHFCAPAATVRLVEVVEGEETSPETLQAATSFAQAIRKLPVRCGECPGLVVDRILASVAGEVWRHQEESGAPVEAIDAFVTEQGLARVGPFRLADLNGLDTTVGVARDLRDAYGERFHVHAGMEALGAGGHLGRKTGRGFYEHGA